MLGSAEVVTVLSARMRSEPMLGSAEIAVD